jgi:hypothetical protein
MASKEEGRREANYVIHWLFIVFIADAMIRPTVILCSSATIKHAIGWKFISL